ncbi:hypothetical protein ACF0H5_003099 [Mactra antiquata]
MFTWCRLRTFLHRKQSPHNLIRHYRTDWEEFPKITVQQKMLEKLEKHNLRKAKEQAKMDRYDLKTLVITSKDKKHQFYKGQNFDIFDPQKLASHRWKNRKCNDDHFTLVAHHGNPSFGKGDAAQPMENLPVDERLKQFLQNEGIKYASNIQSMTIPKLLAGNHVLCAAETGSGKTYAYLLPIIHNIIQQKKRGILTEQSMNSPHTMILVPTFELANQILDVCNKVSQFVPISPMLIEKGSKTRNDLTNDDGKYIDIVVSTPAAILSLMNKKILSLSKMSFVVLDEADTLLDDSFSELTQKVLKKLMIGSSAPSEGGHLNEGVQVALVSATFPRGLDSTIGSILPVDKFEQITTKELHQLMPHIPQKFIRIKSVDRPAKLVSILKKKPGMTYMIFCNKKNSCVFVSRTLTEMGVNNVCVTGYLREKERYEALKLFLDGDCNVLVCTDLASRGIDTTMVTHVINYDFPNFISDYIHRVGRVGRVGSKLAGQVTSFVIHVWEVDLVWKIEIAARKRTDLQNVNANIKAKLISRQKAKAGLEIDDP